MEKNNGRKMRSNKGITLVALVVTIIVLLILAGVSLSAVLSQDGIFHRAEQATDKYGQAKARETLELALGEAQMQKYEEGLTDEELDNQITKIKGELLPKEKPENPNLQNVIVDGYIFEIDRSVPKIVDYIGEANGVIITALVSGNNGWVKEPNVTVTGVIKTYSGGTITSVSGTINGADIPNLPVNGGNYTINNITTDTTIIINAADSTGKSGNKTIPIKVRVDNTPPTVESIDVRAEALKIIFSATGYDNESGIKHFSYKMSSAEDTTLTGIPIEQKEGTFLLGQTVTIKTTPTGNREETKYKITVTATDNCENTTSDLSAKTTEVTAINGITVAEAKQLVRENTLNRYIGIRVTDYLPEKEGKWRVFYYDQEGYFGTENALYLKRDLDTYNIPMIRDGYQSSYLATKEGIEVMGNMNPKWRDYPTKDSNIVDTNYEKSASYLCDPVNWIKYKTDEASFAIGSPSIELFVKSYNVWKQNNKNGTALVCKVESSQGYMVGANNIYRRFNENRYCISWSS